MKTREQREARPVKRDKGEARRDEREEIRGHRKIRKTDDRKESREEGRNTIEETRVKIKKR